MSFEHAVEFVLLWEGGHTKDNRDPGGETNFGISKRAYPDIDIKALTRDAAISIYRQDYWNACRCDELPPPLALLMLNAAVNMGPAAAIRGLQRALRVTIDGQLGPQTMAAVKGLQARHLTREFAVACAIRYFGTANFDVYGKGWIRRLFAAYDAAMKESET